MNNQYRPSGFKMLPTIIKNLLIINGICFLAFVSFQNAFGIDLNEIMGLHFFTSEQFRPYQFITYMFMHASFSHILFNMFALWMFGRVLEEVWGPKRFLIYYVVTGIGAVLIHFLVFYIQAMPILNHANEYLSNPGHEQFQQFLNSEYFKITSREMLVHFNEFVPKYNQLIQTDMYGAVEQSKHFVSQYKMDYLNGPGIVGASGAVYGILLAFGMMFPNTVIYLYFAIPIKAKWFVIMFGAIALYSGLSNKEGDNVAHFAHLGGMIFGYFLIRYWNKSKPQYFS